MSIIAIIPARGGSKGIPQKNIRLLAGKPLIAWTIESAQESKLIDRVAISTDDKEISDIAKHYGAEVIWRPKELSGDTATSESALLHVLDYLRDTEGYESELVVFLQITSPLRKPDDIQNAIKTLRREKADSLFSACKLHGLVWRKNDEQLSSLTYDYRYRKRRQDAPEDLIENGSICIFKPWVLRQFNNRLGGKIAVYLMNVLDSFQIDEPADLELMEQLLTIRWSNPTSPNLAEVCLLVLDFDGVMTDNRVLVDQNGTEAVWCHRADGWGIARLKDVGVEVVVLSTEANPVVAVRCRKLGIKCIQGCNDKLSSLQELAKQRFFKPAQVAFVGNDVNDIACLRWVGIPIAVADAVPAVRAVARLITTQPGGQGSVREVAEWILGAKG